MEAAERGKGRRRHRAALLRRYAAPVRCAALLCGCAAAPLRRTSQSASAVRRTAVRLRRCAAAPHCTLPPLRPDARERSAAGSHACVRVNTHTRSRACVAAVCGRTVARRVGLGPHEALHTCQSNSAHDYVLYAIGTVVVALTRDLEDLGSPSNSRNAANSVSSAMDVSRFSSIWVHVLQMLLNPSRPSTRYIVRALLCTRQEVRHA